MGSSTITLHIELEKTLYTWRVELVLRSANVQLLRYSTNNINT